MFLGLFGFALSSQALSVFDITYPIPELGDCQDQSSCKAYCDDFTNAKACVAFAQKYGIQVEVKTEQVQALQSGPGGCQSETECRAYCDDADNFNECIEFGKANGFISEKEYQEAKEFAVQEGPGGCQGQEECRAFCDNPDNQVECINFGRDHGFIDEEEAEMALKLVNQTGPGGCKGQECKTYCDNPEHSEECIDFAVRNGFMDEEEAQRIKQFTVLEGPGGCKGQECRTYCDDLSHQGECIAFAEKNGMMSPEEAERARKFAGKEGPGGCKGEECRAFCDNPDNTEACLDFAEREGLMPPEELEQAKKFVRAVQQGGPGGCKGNECRTFCEDPANQDECFQFAKQQGLLRPEDEENFEIGRKLNQAVQEKGGPGGCKGEECRTYCTDPSHVEECVAFGAAHAGIPEDRARQMLQDFSENKFGPPRPGEFQQGTQRFRPPEEFQRFEDETFHKFEQFKLLEQEFRGRGFVPPGESGTVQEGKQTFRPSSFAGPGGCTSPDECIKYCTENKEECFSFGEPGQPGATPPEGGIPPGREFQQMRPQLQQNLRIDFEQGELPEFDSEQEQKEFLRENFREFRQEFTQPIPEEQRREIFEQKFQEFRGQIPPEFQQPMNQQIEQQMRERMEQQGIPQPGQMQPEFIPQQFNQPFDESGRPLIPQSQPPQPSGEFIPQQNIMPQGEQVPQVQQVEQVQPPPPSGELAPPPAGGSVIDTAANILRRLLGM